MDGNSKEERAEEEGRLYENAEKDEKIHYRGWKIMPLIICTEACENLGTTGTISNLLLYLITVFNMKSITAATIINIFEGTARLGTLIGAFLSDGYFGRYRTISFCSISSFLGLLVVQLTASVSKLHPTKCNAANEDLCEKATTGQIAFLLSGFALLIIGAAGIKPCNFAFAADQFNPGTEAGQKSIKTFFNWYLFVYTFTQMVSLTVIVYVQSNVSWAIGFGIPNSLMLIALIMFFSGSSLYVKVEVSGSPLTSIMQVIAVAFKKRRVNLVDEQQQPLISLYKYVPLKSPNTRLGHTDQYRFLDKAAVLTPGDKINPDGSPADPWSLCSVQQIEEVKCIIRVFPIWVCGILYYLPLVQLHTYMVFQALQLDRRLWSGSKSTFRIPAASYIVLMMLSFTIFIPIYDRIFLPFLRKITKKEHGITLLQRMGTGLFLSAVTMVVSGIIEGRRRNVALTQPTLGFAARKGEISSMSWLWLIPQLVIGGLSEVFGAIGQMEFFYNQFPENMRSVAGAFFSCSIAGSSYLNGVLISAVHRFTGGSGQEWLPEDLNKGRLDNLYYMVAFLGFLNFCYFLVCANRHQYKRADTSDAD